MEKVLKYLDELDQLIEEGRELDIIKLISRFHPADIADLIDALDEDKKARLFGLLQVETAADVIMEIDEISRELIVEDIPQDKLTQIVDDMESDDATDLISELPEEQAEQILRQIDKEDSEEGCSPAKCVGERCHRTDPLFSR